MRRKHLAAILMVLLLSTVPGGAYAIFTHQQLIDLAWDGTIRPILLHQYPGLTAKGLVQARAYAYGGSIIQDMGYYPVGSRYFSDLTHYVRTGDFVVALFHTARNANELAFAIGALSHYVGDSIGHAEAVNPSTGIVFPKLLPKYGPRGHLRRSADRSRPGGIRLRRRPNLTTSLRPGALPQTGRLPRGPRRARPRPSRNLRTEPAPYDRA